MSVFWIYVTLAVAAVFGLGVFVGALSCPPGRRGGTIDLTGSAARGELDWTDRIYRTQTLQANATVKFSNIQASGFTGASFVNAAGETFNAEPATPACHLRAVE